MAGSASGMCTGWITSLIRSGVGDSLRPVPARLVGDTGIEILLRGKVYSDYLLSVVSAAGIYQYLPKSWH